MSSNDIGRADVVAQKDSAIREVQELEVKYKQLRKSATGQLHNLSDKNDEKKKKAKELKGEVDIFKGLKANLTAANSVANQGAAAPPSNTQPAGGKTADSP